jgi:HAD superfamily hydrolase (TIGR01509 family)
MALSAVIFDVDGTLVDTNQAHVQAWKQALKSHGYQVEEDRIAVEIGKGGDKLIPSVLGQQIDRKDGDSLRNAHTEEFARIAGSERLQLFPGVRPLLDAIRQRGLKLGLATSSKPMELAVTEQSAGVPLSSWFDEVAHGQDASDSKPAPHTLQAAITKLKMSPAQTVMVGDTPYDSQTARDAGSICLGVSCGGMNDSATLRASGMRRVYRDPADMLSQIDQMLTLASPGSAVLDQQAIDSLMREALAAAKQAMEHGELPIGCVIARGDGRIIARGHNQQNASQTKTAHAEMVTFARTAGKVPLDAIDLILVSTLEPCVMCLGAAMEAAVDTILYGLRAPADGGTARVDPPLSAESKMPRIIGEVLADESRKLFEAFLSRPSNNPLQTKFVRDLLTGSQP